MDVNIFWVTKKEGPYKMKVMIARCRGKVSFPAVMQPAKYNCYEAMGSIRSQEGVRLWGQRRGLE